MSSWILAIDTSTEACSCALGCADHMIFRYTDVPRKHAEKVLPMIDELLAEAEISKHQLAGIAFGRGPGAFTGLRIASSVVQGLAFALDIPVTPVSTLQALAQRGFREYRYSQVLAAIDARMAELYWGFFSVNEQGMMVSLGDEKLSAPGAILVPNTAAATIDSFSGVGTGWQYSSQMPAPLNTVTNFQSALYSHALDILTLAQPAIANGEQVSAENALPVYLRNNVAHRN
ncbi:MAG: tRNA (adenosine(37)-N6)-threonylcarbamoyltransferase complex dimerization subunit type 1 TsaB [Pseudomonadales bacterium]|nr:tRNA (adenosine(37)-N6)-threonylcarbamoyltransferase complex dimerization subunit type 1 TsaB [Pseudomonadales bacterium]